jgi:hypothetical protein
MACELRATFRRASRIDLGPPRTTIKLCPQGTNSRKIVPWSRRMASRFFGNPTGQLKALKKLVISCQ